MFQEQLVKFGAYDVPGVVICTKCDEVCIPFTHILIEFNRGAWLASKPVSSNFMFCIDEAQIMACGGDEGFAYVIARELCHFEEYDVKSLSGESSGSIASGRPTADDENLGFGRKPSRRHFEDRCRPSGEKEPR